MPGGLLSLGQGRGEGQEWAQAVARGQGPQTPGPPGEEPGGGEAQAGDLARGGFDLAGLEDGGWHGRTGMSPVSGCRVLP